LTGGNDKNAIIFDKNSEQIVGSLKGHTKKVSCVIYHPNQFFNESRKASQLNSDESKSS